MIENLDELININLDIISKRDNTQMFFMEFEDLEGNQMTEYYRSQIFASKMEEKGLITVTEGLCTITDLGFSINKSGGWIKYLGLLKEKEELTKQVEEQKEKNRKAKEEVEIQKLIDDAKISRLNAKYRYVPYVVSILSFAIACFAYFKPIDKSNKKQLSKDEIIHIIDSISSSNQTKKVDSLHNSKTLDSF